MYWTPTNCVDSRRYLLHLNTQTSLRTEPEVCYLFKSTNIKVKQIPPPPQPLLSFTDHSHQFLRPLCRCLHLRKIGSLTRIWYLMVERINVSWYTLTECVNWTMGAPRCHSRNMHACTDSDSMLHNFKNSLDSDFFIFKVFVCTPI